MDLEAEPGSGHGRDERVWRSRARAYAGAWAVLQFHGVGGDYLTVSEEAHEALLAYLESQRYHVWTAPFGAVAARLRSVRAGR